MSPTAWFHDRRPARPHDGEGTTGALVIAILFVLLALISFAIDQSISLPNQPAKPPALHVPR
jgi:hypothetical protein